MVFVSVFSLSFFFFYLFFFPSLMQAVVLVRIWQHIITCLLWAMILMVGQFSRHLQNYSDLLHSCTIQLQVWVLSGSLLAQFLTSLVYN